MGPSWNSLFRFSENSIKSKHKIEQSGNLRNLWFFLTAISHTYGTIKPPGWAAISILWQVTKFIKKSHLFNTRHSTYTVAIKLRDDILKVTNKDQITLAVMVDYSKAFDTVDYEISITKMHHLNFEKQLLQLKVSYLHKR